MYVAKSWSWLNNLTTSFLPETRHLIVKRPCHGDLIKTRWIELELQYVVKAVFSAYPDLSQSSCFCLPAS